MKYFINNISGDIDGQLLCRVQVSMHNANCTKERLATIVEWLSRLGIREIEFQIADTLHRHNIMWRDDLSEAEAQELARDLGDTWIQDNYPTLASCFHTFDNVSAKRWDYWIKQPEFNTYLKQVKLTFENDTCFQERIIEEASKYFSRINRSAKAERLQHSIDFLLEEIAVTEFGASEQITNEIYPGPRFEPEQYLIDVHPSRYKMRNLSFVNVGISEAVEGAKPSALEAA